MKSIRDRTDMFYKFLKGILKAGYCSRDKHADQFFVQEARWT
jgi:hypothetical protein